MNALSEIMARHVRDASTPTLLPRLTLHQSAETTDLIPATYEAVFCVVAKGRKRVLVGDETFQYNPLTYLVASVNLPVTGHVIEAPYLAFWLRLDPALMSTVVLDMPPLPSTMGRGYGVSQLDGPLLDAVVRFLRLLDQPEHAGMLAPLIEREILYWLLLGPRGDMLRQLSAPSSQLSKVNRAIAVIRSRYAERLQIAELARLVHMSEATFHRHFKAATSMSPLQFQKQIRLQEARRLLLSQDLDAASVAYEVGYESPSQFSREYRRLFGAAPGLHTKRTHRSLIETAHSSPARTHAPKAW